jgi:PhnB protein
MQFIPYLGFNGNAREALEYYAKTLGAKLDMTAFGDTPMGAQIPDAAKNNIMHGVLTLNGSAILMGSDSPGGPAEKVQGMQVALVLDDVAEGERIFTALADGGTTVMPYEKTFWSERFGMCVDRFGTPWMVNAGMVAEASAG